MRTEVPGDAISVPAFARRWAVSQRKIRAWIRAGLLSAIDVGSRGRPQLRITPDAIKQLEERLAVRPAKPARRRAQMVDPEILSLLND